MPGGGGGGGGPIPGGGGGGGGPPIPGGMGGGGGGGGPLDELEGGALSDVAVVPLLSPEGDDDCSAAGMLSLFARPLGFLVEEAAVESVHEASKRASFGTMLRNDAELFSPNLAFNSVTTNCISFRCLLLCLKT